MLETLSEDEKKLQEVRYNYTKYTEQKIHTCTTCIYMYIYMYMYMHIVLCITVHVYHIYTCMFTAHTLLLSQYIFEPFLLMREGEERWVGWCE